MIDTGSKSAAIHKDVVRLISTRDLHFYQNQRAILEGAHMFPLSTVIGTKIVQGVDLLVCFLFIISFIHRFLYKALTYKKRYSKFVNHFNVEEDRKAKLQKFFSNMVENTIEPLSVYADLIIHIIIMLITLLRIIHTHRFFEPEQTNLFKSTNDYMAYKHYTRPMYTIIPDHITYTSVDEKGKIIEHPVTHLQPAPHYLPKNFMGVYIACLIMTTMILILYLTISVYRHRSGVRELVQWKRQPKLEKKKDANKRAQIVRILSQLAGLPEIPRYEKLKTEEEVKDTVPTLPPGRILVDGENYAKLCDTDSFFIHVIGENAYYGCLMMVILRFLDFICVLVTGYMAGKTTLHTEVVIVSEISIILLLLIMYCFVDVWRMGARSIIVPYFYFIFIPVGIIVELPVFHVNRLYVDIMCGGLFFMTLMVALPIHFWKNTSEFMKRWLNEIPTATCKHWEIESYITKKEK